MNTIESSDIYLGKYKENIFYSQNIYEINHCKIKVVKTVNNIRIVNNWLRN